MQKINLIIFLTLLGLVFIYYFGIYAMIEIYGEIFKGKRNKNQYEEFKFLNIQYMQKKQDQYKEKLQLITNFNEKIDDMTIIFQKECEEFLKTYDNFIKQAKEINESNNNNLFESHLFNSGQKDKKTHKTFNKFEIFIIETISDNPIILQILTPEKMQQFKNIQNEYKKENSNDLEKLVREMTLNIQNLVTEMEVGIKNIIKSNIDNKVLIDQIIQSKTIPLDQIIQSKTIPLDPIIKDIKKEQSEIKKQKSSKVN